MMLMFVVDPVDSADSADVVDIGAAVAVYSATAAAPVDNSVA